MHSIDALQAEVARLRDELRHLQGLPDEVRKLKGRIEELEEQLQEALESNRKLVLQLNNMDTNIMKLLVVMQGDAAFRRKGVLDEMAELKEVVQGFVTLKTKALAIIGAASFVGVGGLLWAARHLDIIIKALAK